MSYQCPRCIERGQTWNGDAPVCGFYEDGSFREDNWNCATLNALREMGEENRVWSDEYNMTIVQRFDVGYGILKWYKNRGKTDDFRDGYFKAGTLRLAQELLGDVEHHNDWDDWDGDSD